MVHLWWLLLYIYMTMTVMNTKSDRKYFSREKILIISITFPYYNESKSLYTKIKLKEK